MITDEQKVAWAKEQLKEKFAEIGRLPKKEDFDKTVNMAEAAAYSRARNTVSGGYLAKQVRSGFQHIMLDEEGADCHTKKYFEIKLDKNNSGLFQYRYILDGKNEVCLTPEIMPKYIDKKVKMRSPLYCTGDKICSKCAGQFYYRIGMRNVGILLDNATGVIMNKSMKMFHDASVKITKLDISTAIKRIK